MLKTEEKNSIYLEKKILYSPYISISAWEIILKLEQYYFHPFYIGWLVCLTPHVR